MELQYGKKIISYYDGKPSEKVEYSVPVLVKDKSQVLSEIIKAIDLITSKQTHSLTLTIKTDKSHRFKTLIKEYIREEI